jgi:homoserine O-acetyltransferase
MPSLGDVQPQSMHFAEPLGLASGAVLRDYTLAYETYGTLNAARSNAVLVCHALNASHHVAGTHAGKEKTKAGGTTWSARASRSTPIASSWSASTTGLVLRLDRRPIPPRPGGEGPRLRQRLPVVTVEDWVDAQAR